VAVRETVPRNDTLSRTQDSPGISTRAPPNRLANDPGDRTMEIPLPRLHSPSPGDNRPDEEMLDGLVYTAEDVSAVPLTNEHHDIHSLKMILPTVLF
jgi:hypothetical protein